MKNKNKHIMFMVAILLFQVMAGTLHLYFDGELFNNVYYLNNQLLHIGLLPSIVIWILMRGEAARMLGSALVLYNITTTMMEIAAMNGYKEIVLTVNSYYYSELIFIMLALLLSIIGTHLKHGIHFSTNSKLNNILLLLQRSITFKKRNKTNT